MSEPAPPPSAPPPPPAPPAGKAAPDLAGQIRQAIAQVERALLLLQPVRPEYQAHYDRLRALRDRLEEAFTAALTRRLQKDARDFSADVAALAKVDDDLEQATRRADRSREIIGYIATAVETATQVTNAILSFVL